MLRKAATREVGSFSANLELRERLHTHDLIHIIFTLALRTSALKNPRSNSESLRSALQLIVVVARTLPLVFWPLSPRVLRASSSSRARYAARHRPFAFWRAPAQPGKRAEVGERTAVRAREERMELRRRQRAMGSRTERAMWWTRADVHAIAVVASPPNRISSSCRHATHALCAHLLTSSRSSKRCWSSGSSSEMEPSFSLSRRSVLSILCAAGTAREERMKLAKAWERASERVAAAGAASSQQQASSGRTTSSSSSGSSSCSRSSSSSSLACTSPLQAQDMPCKSRVARKLSLGVVLAHAPAPCRAGIPSRSQSRVPAFARAARLRT